MENSIEFKLELDWVDNAMGAAIHTDNYDELKIINDLFVGNKVIGNTSIEHEEYYKNRENVYVHFPHSDPVNSLGYDNGTATTDTVEQVYGKYPVSPSVNGNKTIAGRVKDGILIPTIMIAPKLNSSVGTANMTGGKGTEYDQRGFKRTGKSDIGALEISSVLYDANGGNFTLPELKKYDGKTYYEGKNPKQYAKVGNPSSAYTIINGKKVLNPVRSGYNFIGWSNDKAAKLPSTKFAPNKKVTVEDQQIVYAVWKKKTYALKYHSNGKTSGTIPIQNKVLPNTSITIKTQGKLKRKGYKFSGWSTKPSAKKGEAAYAPGKKLKLVKNTKLYAIWKR